MTRTFVFHVRLSEEERELAEAKRRKKGYLTIADWFRSLLGRKPAKGLSERNRLMGGPRAAKRRLCTRCYRLHLSGCENCVGKGSWYWRKAVSSKPSV